MLLETPLIALHQTLGAKLVPFAGYSMPISYPGGIIAEHNHTRSQVGLFDVSHMGQVTVIGDSVAERLERVMPNDFISLAPMSCVYGLLLNEKGGVRDDLIATNLGDGRFNLVLNASNKQEDLAYLRSSLPDLAFEPSEDRALLALRGPESRVVMTRLGKSSSGLGFMMATQDQIDGLINNAANNPKVGEDEDINFSRLENFPIENWAKDLAVGLTGSFICAKYYGTQISKNLNGGSIVNISSDLALIGPDQRLYLDASKTPSNQPVKPVSYSVVKAGILGLTRYLATYWPEKKVRCNAICPAGVENQIRLHLVATAHTVVEVDGGSGHVEHH